MSIESFSANANQVGPDVIVERSVEVDVVFREGLVVLADLLLRRFPYAAGSSPRLRSRAMNPPSLPHHCTAAKSGDSSGTSLCKSLPQHSHAGDFGLLRERSRLSRDLFRSQSDCFARSLPERNPVGSNRNAQKPTWDAEQATGTARFSTCAAKSAVRNLVGCTRFVEFTRVSSADHRPFVSRAVAVWAVVAHGNRVAVEDGSRVSRLG